MRWRVAAGPLAARRATVRSQVTGNIPRHTPHSCALMLATTASCDNDGHAWQWDVAAQQCGARRIVSPEWLGTLHGQHIVFAGDSTVRLLYMALTRLAGGPGTPHTYV